MEFGLHLEIRAERQPRNRRIFLPMVSQFFDAGARCCPNANTFNQKEAQLCASHLGDIRIFTKGLVCGWAENTCLESAGIGTSPSGLNHEFIALNQPSRCAVVGMAAAPGSRPFRQERANRRDSNSPFWVCSAEPVNSTPSKATTGCSFFRHRLAAQASPVALVCLLARGFSPKCEIFQNIHR